MAPPANNHILSSMSSQLFRQLEFKSLSIILFFYRESKDGRTIPKDQEENEKKEEHNAIKECLFFSSLKYEYFIYSTNVIIRLVYFVQYECILDVEK